MTLGHSIAPSLTHLLASRCHSIKSSNTDNWYPTSTLISTERKINMSSSLKVRWIVFVAALVRLSAMADAQPEPKREEDCGTFEEVGKEWFLGSNYYDCRICCGKFGQFPSFVEANGGGDVGSSNNKCQCTPVVDLEYICIENSLCLDHFVHFRMESCVSCCKPYHAKPKANIIGSRCRCEANKWRPPNDDKLGLENRSIADSSDVTRPLL